MLYKVILTVFVLSLISSTLTVIADSLGGIIYWDNREGAKIKLTPLKYPVYSIKYIVYARYVDNETVYISVKPLRKNYEETINIKVNVYDYYTGEMIDMINGVVSKNITVHSNITVLEIIYGNSKPSYYYVYYHPGNIYPEKLRGIFSFIPLAFFVALGVKLNPNIAGIGMIIYSILLPMMGFIEFDQYTQASVMLAFGIGFLLIIAEKLTKR